MILLFYSLKSFFNPMTAIITAGLYGLMAMSNNVLGFAAHATHFVVFFFYVRIIFFSKINFTSLTPTIPSPPNLLQRRMPSLSFGEGGGEAGLSFLFGAMLGMAFLMKQQAVYFILFGGIVFLLFLIIGAGRDLKSRLMLMRIINQITIFSLGVFIPYIIIVLIMLASGTFEKFWFWTVQYAGKYASGTPMGIGKGIAEDVFCAYLGRTQMDLYFCHCRTRNTSVHKVFSQSKDTCCPNRKFLFMQTVNQPPEIFTPTA